LIGVLLRRFVSGATISKNKVSANAGYGVVVDGGSSLNTIEGNEAVDNVDAGLELRGAGVLFTRTNAAPPVLDLTLPDRPPYTPWSDFIALASSGDRTGRLVPIDVALSPSASSFSNPNASDTSTSGCEASDFSRAGFQAGDIALIQRGTCTLDRKLENAVLAGASAIIFFNEGQAPGRISASFGTVGEPFAQPLSLLSLPVLSTSYEVGFDLYNQARLGPITIRVFAATQSPLNPAVDTPATHNNLVTRNLATTASDENRNCGSNRWTKNAFGSVNRPCVAGDLTDEGTGGGGLGATSHNY
jgi:parallel beta-helix repeat protein